MANHWLRLWHDMPNDPKWRTIARISKQPIANVLAVYIHILVDASTNASERGRTQANTENISSALDIEIDQIDAIILAMQGRVLDGQFVTGWDKRQPSREDGSAERARAWRENQKQRSAYDEKNERKRTQTNANEPKIKSILKKEYLDKELEDNVPDVKKTKPLKYFPPESFEIWVSSQIGKMVMNLHPSDRHVSKAISTDFQSWANEINVFMKKYNRSESEIRTVIEWLNGDSNEARFWRGKNIRSTSKFCDKYDDLVLQMNSSRQLKATARPSQMESKYQQALDWAKKKDESNLGGYKNVGH